jgi:hypothetical protein
LSKSKTPSKKTIIKAYVGLLGTLQELEDEDYDMQKLILKQLHMRQLISLKSKGRFLDETKIFDGEVKCLPSAKS